MQCTECEKETDKLYGYHLKLCKSCFDLWRYGEKDLKLKTEIELRIQWIKQEITLTRRFKADGSVGFKPMITFIESEIVKVEKRIDDLALIILIDNETAKVDKELDNILDKYKNITRN